MKMKTEHFVHLKNELNKVLEKYPDIAEDYRNGNYTNSHKTKDVQRRFCFDILYGAGLGSWVCTNLYSYLNDENIYTALKAICPKVS